MGHAIEFYKRYMNVRALKKGISAETLFYLLNGFGIVSVFISVVAIIYRYDIVAAIFAMLSAVVIVIDVFLAVIFKKLTFPFVFDIFKMKWRREGGKCILFTLDSSGMLDARIGYVDANMKRVYDPYSRFYYRYTGKEIFLFHGLPALIVYRGIGQAIDPIMLKALQKIHEMGFEDKYDFLKAMKQLNKDISRLKEELKLAKAKNDEDKIKLIEEQLKSKETQLDNIKKVLEIVPLFNINLEAVMNFLSNQNAHLDLLAVETAFTAGQQMARRDDYTSMSDIMKWMLPIVVIFGIIMFAYMFFK
ncbi:hypothetical protein ACO3UB_08450 (plasmid) [Methanocaldococcus sp. 16A]